MSGFWLLERIGLHRLDIFLTKALNREDKWAEFRLDTDREIERHGNSGETIRPFVIRFYYTGDRLQNIALEGVIGRGGGTTVNYYDREEDVPQWILDMVEKQIEEAGR